MTQENDHYYQPWAQRSASPPPPAATGGADNGLAKPRGVTPDSPPLGLDISALPLPDTDDARAISEAPAAAERLGAAVTTGAAHVTKGLESSARGARTLGRVTADGLARLTAAARRGALAFADWTIKLGQRADVPARVAAMQIPARTTALTGAATAVIARSLGGAGRAIADTSRRGWQALALGARTRRAGARIAGAASNAGAGLAKQASALRRPNAPRDDAAVPPSGLDALVAEADRPAGNAPPRGAAPDLPLFAGPAVPETVATAPPAVLSGSPPALAPATADAPPVRAAAAPPAGAGQPAMVPRQWLAYAAGGTALALLGAFWLGTRLAGGGAGTAAPDMAAIDERVRAYILANPDIIPQAIEAQRAQELADAIGTVRPLLEKPFAGAWVGNPNGDVVVTVFTDYGCVFCRASVADVDRLVKEDARVKVVFRELPIIAPQSRDAAIAALRAARQGKYDAFHHAMFAAGDLGEDAITAASTRAGVILSDRADAAADERLFEQEIENNMTIARQLGLNATPTWVIGNQLVQGAVGYGELKAAVAKARQDAKG